MKILLDDTSAGGIAKVVDTLYKKGVYDAVQEKNAPFTKTFAEEKMKSASDSSLKTFVKKESCN